MNLFTKHLHQRIANSCGKAEIPCEKRIHSLTPKLNRNSKKFSSILIIFLFN